MTFKELKILIDTKIVCGLYNDYMNDLWNEAVRQYYERERAIYGELMEIFRSGAIDQRENV